MEIKAIFDSIVDYIPFENPMTFILGFVVGYIVRLIVGRTKGVYYSVKNLFRVFK